MTENEISALVLDSCLAVHRRLGPGLFESVYEESVSDELAGRGLSIARQQAVPLVYKGVTIDVAFRADIIVESKVLLEIKSVEQILPVHKMQVLTYLRLIPLKLGLLVNFNVPLLKLGFRRIVNGL